MNSILFRLSIVVCVQGRLKLVKTRTSSWELYDMVVDRTEAHNLAGAHKAVVDALAAQWDVWAHCSKASCSLRPCTRTPGKTCTELAAAHVAAMAAVGNTATRGVTPMPEPNAGVEYNL